MRTHNIHYHDKNEISNHRRYLQLRKKNLGTQEHVRNSHGKQAIGVRGIEVSVHQLRFLHVWWHIVKFVTNILDCIYCVDDDHFVNKTKPLLIRSSSEVLQMS